jgi:aspartyl-tRNA(Asn)/glutamyl-tRNA(Gln) amidotransferase subunit C
MVSDALGKENRSFPITDRQLFQAHQYATIGSMSTVDVETIDHLARLSRLIIRSDEKNTLVTQLSDIIAYIGRLSEVHDSSTPVQETINGLQNVTRSDEPSDSLTPEVALQNVPPARLRDHKVVVPGVFNSPTDL